MEGMEARADSRLCTPAPRRHRSKVRLATNQKEYRRMPMSPIVSEQKTMN